jgi:anti-sigma regulatory factor (Ser/Thr protein kinase)
LSGHRIAKTLQLGQLAHLTIAFRFCLAISDKPYNLLSKRTLQSATAMKTKDFILKMLREKGSITTSDIVKKLRISRQTAAQHCRELTRANRLAKLNRTRNARYVAYTPRTSRASATTPVLHATYATCGLEEDRVFQEVELKMGLRRALSAKAHQIAGYAFTEMMNNAIEHSRAPQVGADAHLGQTGFEFVITDRGIGVFESIRRKFGLRDHFEAVSHLLKGKQTTDPRRHSGQGIFFTSKIADRFTLTSSRLSLLVDNELPDVVLQDVPPHRGTRVEFQIKRASRRDLKALFDDYSGADYEFDKTHVLVRLSRKPGETTSRSQARRLLLGLEAFKRIVLDFKGVAGIGQGFADEVFRVFKRRHPEIQLEPLNMSPSVKFMVERSGSRL